LNDLDAVSRMSSPDDNAAGLLPDAMDPLRYDGDGTMDPDEVSGIVASMIPVGARVLDVGCGTGSLSKILVDACSAEVVGIEPDRARAERARSRGIKVHVGYLEPALLRVIGAFDIVLLADVLEHLPNPRALLLNSREALGIDGSVIVSVPNVAHWSVRTDILRGRFQYRAFGIMDATHLRWFTAATLKSLIISAGFDVTAYRATAGLALPDLVLRRPWRWLRKSDRSRLFRAGARHWPTLFGCQHIVRAIRVQTAPASCGDFERSE